MPENNELVKMLRTVIQEELKPVREEYQEFRQEVHQELQELRQGQEELRQGQNRLENKVDKLEARIENDVIEKVRALFEAREVQSDVNQQILNTLQRMEAKIDVLQMETAYIRSVK